MMATWSKQWLRYSRQWLRYGKTGQNATTTTQQAAVMVVGVTAAAPQGTMHQ
jgi:hypothetical protein